MLRGLRFPLQLWQPALFGSLKSIAILGSLVAALVTAQRAFPFGPRAQFYRVLIGQTANLMTDLQAGLPVSSAVATLKTLRLDFAQQLPRGTAQPDSGKSSG